MTRQRKATTLVAYALSVGLTAAVTLASIPILISVIGAHSWAALAVGQAVGTGGAIVVGFGWGITGPTVVAQAGSSERVEFFVTSIWARAFLFVPAVAITATATAVVAHHAVLSSALTAVAYTMTGLLSGWFFTGAARPWSFFWFDAMPRALGAAVGTALVWAGASLWSYPASLVGGVLIGVVVTISTVSGRATGKGRTAIALWQTIRAQSHGMQLSSVSALVTALPPIVIAAVAPAALPAYALGDKLMRFATTAFSPVLQFLQGWVPAATGADRMRRVRSAIVVGLVAAVVGGVAFALLAPPLSRLLSGAAVQFSTGLAVLFALLLALLVAAQAVGLVGLLALGAAREYAQFAVVGAVVSLPLLTVGALINGAPGAVSGFVVGEAVALTLEFVLLIRLLRADTDGGR